MITLIAAENFVKSKFALFLGCIAALSFVITQNAELKKDIAAARKEKRESDSIHRIELNKRDAMIYNIQQQDKINADNATQAEKYRTEKYEALYNTVLQVKNAAKQKNILNQ